MYRLNGYPPKPINDWVKMYEQLWSKRLDRLDEVLAELKDAEMNDTEDGADGNDK